MHQHLIVTDLDISKHLLHTMEVHKSIDLSMYIRRTKQPKTVEKLYFFWNIIIFFIQNNYLLYTNNNIGSAANTFCSIGAVSYGIANHENPTTPLPNISFWITNVKDETGLIPNVPNLENVLNQTE